VDWIKSPVKFPERAMLLRVAVAVPVLLTVTFCSALAVPIFCGPKVAFEDDKLMTGVWAVSEMLLRIKKATISSPWFAAS
jgi:hypothetical protein